MLGKYPRVADSTLLLPHYRIPLVGLDAAVERDADPPEVYGTVIDSTASLSDISRVFAKYNNLLAVVDEESSDHAQDLAFLLKKQNIPFFLNRRGGETYGRH